MILDLTPKEIVVLMEFLDTNPCDSGCVYPYAYMKATNEDCVNCEFVKIRYKILGKIYEAEEGKNDNV